MTVAALRRISPDSPLFRLCMGAVSRMLSSLLFLVIAFRRTALSDAGCRFASEISGALRRLLRVYRLASFDCRRATSHVPCFRIASCASRMLHRLSLSAAVRVFVLPSCRILLL